MTGMIIGFICWFMHMHYSSSGSHTVSSALTENITNEFPKVLWIYSDNEFDSLNLVDATLANYYIDEGLRANYQVRLINHTSAYDWLSEEMVLRVT